MTKVVVYTSITGGKDLLKDGQCNVGAHFVAYTDTKQESSVWDMRPVTKIDRDNNRNAKQYKVLPHKFFPEYEYSLWIDGSIELAVPVQTLIDKYLKDANVAQFKHPTRDCSYAEGSVCIEVKNDDPLIILEQIQRYKAEGLPEHAGLNECTIMLRRHNEPDVVKFNELWWAEIEGGSRRDQVSYPYCLWKTGLKVNNMPGTVETIYGNPQFPGNDYFVYTKHLK